MLVMKLLHKNKEKAIEIRFLHDALLVDKKILVFGDLHIGFEEHIADQGIFPRVQLKKIIEKLSGIFELLKKDKIEIEKVIILGDLKHEFGGISDAEWRDTLDFLDFVSKNIKKDEGDENIILIKGNHDNILGPIAKKRSVKLVDFYKYKQICFLHGNKLHGNCFSDSKFLIMGHLHPAITLRDEYKKEKYKCFLKGKWKGKETYVLPSFSPISFGYDLDSIEDSIHKGEFLIVKDKLLENFNVIIYNSRENKEYDFGKLKKIVKKNRD